MFKNLFNLKVYNSTNREDNLIEIKTVDELHDVYRYAKLMPVFSFNEKDYIPGDLYLNKETNEILIFSFHSHLSDFGLNSIGFYYIKNVEVFLKTPSLFDIQDSEKTPFPLISLNKFNGFNSFKKIGNLILNKDFSRHFLIKLYSNITINDLDINESFNSLFDIVHEMMDIKILAKNHDTKDCEVHYSHSLNKHLGLNR